MQYAKRIAPDHVRYAVKFGRKQHRAVLPHDAPLSCFGLHKHTVESIRFLADKALYRRVLLKRRRLTALVPVCHGIPVRHCGKAGREQHDIACGFRDFPSVRINKHFCPVRRRRKQLRVADIIRLNVIILPADTGIIIVKRVLPIAAANPQHALRRFSDFRRHDIPHFGLKQDIAVRVINCISHGKRAFDRRAPYRLNGTGRCNDLLRFQVDEVSVQLAEAQSEYDYLNTRMNDITSRASLQQVAEGELGLVKADPSQITYVQLEDQSIIERNTGAAGRLLDEVRTAALSLLDSLNP